MRERMLIAGSFLAGIGLVSIGTYLLVSGAVDRFAFAGVKFLAGEFWRLMTFPVVHVSSSHLLENIIAMVIAFGLAWELEEDRVKFIFSFAMACLVVATLNMAFFPTMLIAGASVGIYAVFGAISANGSMFLSARILTPALAVPLLVRMSFQVAESHSIALSVGLHAIGFIVGCLISIATKYVRPARARVLEAASE